MVAVGIGEAFPELAQTLFLLLLPGHLSNRDRDHDQGRYRRGGGIEDEDAIQADRASDDRPQGRAHDEGGPGCAFDVAVDASQTLRVVGEKGPEGRDGGEHGHPDQAEEEGRHHEAGMVSANAHSQRHRDEDNFTGDEDAARVESVDEDPCHGRPDQRCNAQRSHDGRHSGSRSLHLESGLAPDADEERCLTPAAGDEPGQDDPSDITICPHDS